MYIVAQREACYWNALTSELNAGPHLGALVLVQVELFCGGTACLCGQNRCGVLKSSLRGMMFSSIREWWLGRRALRPLMADPIGAAAVRNIRQALGDTSRGIGRHSSRKFKEEIAQRLLQDLCEILGSGDRVLANREKLATYTLVMAKYQVLVLPPEGDPEPEITGLRGLPGISGELRAHLDSIAGKDEEIRNLRYGIPVQGPDALYTACLLSYWRAGIGANVFDHTRRALGDFHTLDERDWYRPFLASMCAWHEHQFRLAIGLPDVLAEQDESGEMAGLKHSTFLNIVMSGAQHPGLEWEPPSA